MGALEIPNRKATANEKADLWFPESAQFKNKYRKET